MRQSKVLAAAAMLLLLIAGGCKSSGIAVSGKAQILHIGLEIPTDLSDGETQSLRVEVANRGLTEIDNVEFEVEIPNELIILDHDPETSLEFVEFRSERGTRVFRYGAGDLELGSEAKVSYKVRAAFGTLARTGDIVVTAMAHDLPGGHLVESKHVKLRPDRVTSIP